MMPADRPLTAKQQRFVDAYDGNATQAALKAGYSERTARAIGVENLTKPAILKAIQDREAPKTERRIATREERQAFWTEVLQNQGEQMKDRLKASELLGKSNADFTDRVIGDLNLTVTRKTYGNRDPK